MSEGLDAKLTKAQKVALCQWPDAWMAASEVLHARIPGNVASTLADKGLLERRNDPNTWGRCQYRLSATGQFMRDAIALTAEPTP